MKNKELANKSKKVAKVAVKNWQPILIILGVSIAGYITYKAVTKVTGGITDWNPGNNPGDGGGNPNQGGDNQPPLNSGYTISQNQAQTIAAGLFQAMVVWNGTDEERIFSLLTGKTPKDYTLISQAFGEPRYDDFAEAFWPFPKKNLSYWLNSELDQEEMNKLKQLIPGVF